MDPVKQCCRLCLAPSPKKYASITDYALRSKLDAIFKFELLLEDSLPHVICSECSIKIDEFYFFHETVRTNQDQLKSIPVPDTDLLMLVEIKEEPLHINDTDAEEEELTATTAAAAVDQNDLPSLMSELYGPDPAQNKYVQDEKSKKTMEDNLKILQFFNGITCSICSEEFETFGQLMAHGKTEHDKQVNISCCDRKFIKKSILIQHINLHLNSKLFFCEPCQKNYKTKYYLDVHNFQFHANPEHHEYQCNKCPKKFPRKSLLAVHLKGHVKKKCFVCDQMLSNNDSLGDHMLKVHNQKHGNSVPVHICDMCGQAFRQKKNLQRHIELHHFGFKNADRIQCPVCAKWVNNKHYLKYHIRNVHSEENLQVTCDICQQVYPNKRVLTTHKSSVHTERNLECDVCGKMFKMQKHLKEHRAAHTNHRRYSCLVCSYASNYNSNVYKHMKTQHPAEWVEAKARGGPLFPRLMKADVG